MATRTPSRQERPDGGVSAGAGANTGRRVTAADLGIPTDARLIAVTGVMIAVVFVLTRFVTFSVGPGGYLHLGDIAISLPTAIKQANAIGHPLASELAHLLVHGMLHLCGYDHVDSPEDEAAMREREEKYLGAGIHHGPAGHVH